MIVGLMVFLMNDGQFDEFYIIVVMHLKGQEKFSLCLWIHEDIEMISQAELSNF